MKTGKEKFFGTKNFWLLVIGICAGLALILWGSVSSDTDKKSGGAAETGADSEAEGHAHLSEYEREMENKIRVLLSSVNGISEVNVMVTFESGSEYVYAQNGSDSQKTYVIADGTAGEGNAVLVKEIYPRLRGIAVVCRGGSDARLQERVISMLCALFDLPSNRVYVTG